MAKVQDVARFFVDLAQKQADNSCGDLMTNLRLQKLLYFAQGWYLARYGKPLFRDDMEAWQYGPVVPAVYNEYAQYGRNGISDAQAISMDNFTDDEYALLLDVAREYTQFATSTLVDISHKKGAPWDNTPYREIIPKADMREYFSAQTPLPTFAESLKALPVITPERDNDGTAVLSSAEADEWDDYDED